jgi:autotransporter-associated beta strand protein
MKNLSYIINTCLASLSNLRKNLSLALPVLGLFGVAATGYAQTTSSWTGSSDSTWSTAGNWGAGVPSSTVSALFNGTFTNQPNLTTGSTTHGIWLTSGASQDVMIGASSAQTLALTGNATLNSIANAGIYMNDTTNNRNLTFGSNVTVQLVNNTAFYNSQSSGALTFDGVFNINGSKALTVGSANATGNVVFNGGINNLQTATFIASGGNVTVNGALAGTATTTGGFRLTAGTLTMNLTNTGHTFHIMSGTANGNTGTLRIASANTLNGTGNFTFGDGTVLNTSGSAITSGMTALLSTVNSGRDIFFGQAGDTSANNLTFTGAGASTVDFGVAGGNGSSITINGSGVTISTNTTWTNGSAASRTLTVNGAGNTFVLAGLGLGATGANVTQNQTITGTGNLLITGAVTNGNASSDQGIIKTGNGTLTLGGSNTYTGATMVAAGTLIVNGSTSATSAVTVNASATLGGSGTINGAATINGRLQIGTNPGVLSFGNSLSLASTANVTLQVNGTDRGTGYDGINITNGLTYGGALDIAVQSQFLSSNQTFSLFSMGSQSGDFSSVSLSGAYGSGTFTFASNIWSYTDSSNNQWTFNETNGNLAFTAIPEPSTWILVALGCSFLFWGVRRSSATGIRKS